MANFIQVWSLQRFVFFSFLICGIYYVTLFDNGSTIETQARTTQTTLDQKKTELEKIRRAEKEKAKTEEEMNLIAEQFKNVLQYLPTEFNQADLMRDVIDEARIAGTRNIRIEPQERAERNEFYESMLIEINFEGTFAQIATFLAAITKIPRIINVIKADIAMKEDLGEQPILSFKGVLAGYRYLDKKPDAAKGGK